MAHLEGAYEQLSERFADMTSAMKARFGQVDSRLDQIGQKVDGLQWRMTSLIVATWVTTMIAFLLTH